ncbi:hypothetical protein EHS19_01430 [Bifidobacterium jacchi]|uniref:Uncharacterized protein n=1 Tax=Bifidobacterium jacchi TaxID=2490545 RepID=A0A5N5RLZ6_9BIFI|nr:hypothetical protein EHS19_01430 [Bifidobacterium jacchi]
MHQSADGDVGVVHAGEVHVAVNAFAHAHMMESPVGVRRSLHMAALADFGEQLVDQSLLA